MTVEHSFWIDGTDAYTAYGVWLTDNSLADTVCIPPSKEVAYNDWQEEDGLECDLSDPLRSDTRSVTLNLAAGRGGDMDGFMAVLNAKPYHTFDFGIGRTFVLRYEKQASITYCTGLTLLSLTLYDDTPPFGEDELEDESRAPLPPAGGVTADGAFRIGKRLFAEYGICILAGTAGSILSRPEAKQNMLRNIKTVSGVIYDPSTATFKSKDITLNCLMTARNMDGFWQNWRALVYELFRPGERTIAMYGKTLPCYYRSCKVSRFAPFGDKVRMAFTLTMRVTGNLAERYVEGLLVTDDNRLVVIEGNRNILINSLV